MEFKEIGGNKEKKNYQVLAHAPSNRDVPEKVWKVENFSLHAPWLPIRVKRFYYHESFWLEGFTQQTY